MGGKTSPDDFLSSWRTTTRRSRADGRSPAAEPRAPARPTTCQRRDRWRASSSVERRESRARSRTCTSRPPSWCSRASWRGRCCVPCGCPSTSGTGLSAGTWVGLDNYREVVTNPELREPFLHSLILLIYFSALPITLGLALAWLMTRSRVRGLERLPHRHLRAPGDRDGRRRDRVAADLRARGRAQRRVVVRRARPPRAMPGSATRRTPSRLSAWSAPGSARGCAWCSSSPACRRCRVSSTRRPRSTAPGRCGSSSPSGCRRYAASWRSRSR